MKITLPIVVLLAAGLAWGAPAPAPVDLGAGKQPRLAIDSDGAILAVYGNGNSILFSRSTDEGKTFAAAVEVARVKRLYLGMRRGPRIAASAHEIVISAIAGEDETGQSGDLLAWRSGDHGKTWSAPVKVNSVANSAREGLHDLAAGADDHFFIAWLDDRSKSKELYGARSADGGKTFADALIYKSPDGHICECCHPSVAIAPDGTVNVMFRNFLAGKRDMYLAASRDGGGTFQDARKLGTGSWTFNACPMDGGAIAADGRAVDTIWRRQSNIYLTTADAAERPLGAGMQPSLALVDGAAHAVWITQRNGDLMYQPPAREAARIAEHASDPMLVAAGKGALYCAWESADHILIAPLPPQPALPTR